MFSFARHVGATIDVWERALSWCNDHHPWLLMDHFLRFPPPPESFQNMYVHRAINSLSTRFKFIIHQKFIVEKHNEHHFWFGIVMAWITWSRRKSYVPFSVQNILVVKNKLVCCGIEELQRNIPNFLTVPYTYNRY